MAEEEWLESFRGMAAQGYFVNEPEFPRALEEYERA
jgi:hypothetical protein